jgi:Mg-chelatase subunit ChlI
VGDVGVGVGKHPIHVGVGQAVLAQAYGVEVEEECIEEEVLMHPPKRTKRGAAQKAGEEDEEEEPEEQEEEDEEDEDEEEEDEEDEDEDEDEEEEEEEEEAAAVKGPKGATDTMGEASSEEQEDDPRSFALQGTAAFPAAIPSYSHM